MPAKYLAHAPCLVSAGIHSCCCWLTGSDWRGFLGSDCGCGSGLGSNPCHGKADPSVGDCSPVWKGKKQGVMERAGGTLRPSILGHGHTSLRYASCLTRRRLAQDILKSATLPHFCGYLKGRQTQEQALEAVWSETSMLTSLGLGTCICEWHWGADSAVGGCLGLPPREGAVETSVPAPPWPHCADGSRVGCLLWKAKYNINKVTARPGWGSGVRGSWAGGCEKGRGGAGDRTSPAACK